MKLKEVVALDFFTLRPELPMLPPRISRLSELAYNLWWSWNPEAGRLYAAIDPELWEYVYHNPVRFLRRVDARRLERAASDGTFLTRYQQIMAAFDAYMEPGETWFERTHPHLTDHVIAYFSAEFGLHESLPIYSGGLGVLSGDHCKAASDLGLPFVGVGFLYPQGYFRQQVNAWGDQEAIYEKLNFTDVPAQPATNRSREQIVVQVDLPGRQVYATVWQIQVGRVPLFLLDTDVHLNATEDRSLAARLYGGDGEMRIAQEIMLGIGGVRAVRALGIKPTVWHMNEGHSAFVALERIREMVTYEGLTFDEAREAATAGNVFTTHTPVAAGHDAFPFELMEKYFWNYWPQMGLDRDGLMALGYHVMEWGARFSMTKLALKLSSRYNGVSELHGGVSRRMWHELWPDRAVEDVPIRHITNGVHVRSWLAPELARLFDTHLGDGWEARLDEPATWDAVKDIPNAALWEIHRRQKQMMINYLRQRTRRQRERNHASVEEVAAAESLLDPNALTIGFARRFATYKRATLIFRDIERIKRVMNQPGRPVQIIFAGKAHPADEPGKALIKHIVELSKQPGFKGRVVFIEDYDINIARFLVRGVDLWLNNPRQPLEASGTSGQKAALNGVPNLSVLDGWWPEAYDGTNGWAIGNERDYSNVDEQDAADAESLYSTLENEIIPLFYDRDADEVPHGWLRVIKSSIRTCAPHFSMRRMVKEYVEQMYVPVTEADATLEGTEHAPTHEALA
ncbi:MAG: alpha-glucan family phosphorylase [Anaerolineae bacterium]